MSYYDNLQSVGAICIDYDPDSTCPYISFIIKNVSRPTSRELRYYVHNYYHMLDNSQYISTFENELWMLATDCIA